MRFFLILILLTFASISFADVMRVTILGSGTPRPDINRFSQSILVEAGGEKPVSYTHQTQPTNREV